MKKMIARLLIITIIFAIVQPVLLAEKMSAAEIPPDVIFVEADKFVDSSGGYGDGIDDNGVPNLLVVGYARDQAGDYGAANAALRFDLSLVKSERRIKSVQLQIYVKRVDTTGGDTPFIDLWGSNTDGWNDDSTVTLPGHQESIMMKVTPQSNFSGWQSFDVTDFVSSRVPHKKATFVLRGLQSAPPVPLLYQPQIFFYDRSHANYASRLLVTYAENEPPTDITLSPNSIPENNVADAVVGTLSATDPDAGDTVTFSINAGASSPFTVSGNQLKVSQSLDYEAKSAHTVSIRATDSAGSTFDKDITVSVTNVDEPPTSATININNGATVTNSTSVTLAMTHNDPDVDKPQYRLTNEDGSPWSEWKTFETPVSWSLPLGDGLKTVYMELRDGTGAVVKAQDSIVLDTTPPEVTGVENNAIYQEDVTITFNEGTATLNGSPISSGMKIQTDGSFTLRVTDAAGNVTTVLFTVDRTPPTGSVSINGGVAFTKSQNVTLTVTGSDGGSGNVKVRFSPNNTDWGEFGPLVSVIPFTLPAGDGEKTVYMQVKDEAGNISNYEDKITLDSTPPTGAIEINNGSEATAAEKVAITLQASDAIGPVEVLLSNDSSYAGGSWVSIPSNNQLEWSLSTGDGSKTVYAKFRDGSGNEYETTDTIVLDQTPPAVTGVLEGSFYMDAVTPVFNEGTATLNAVAFTSGTKVREEGKYVLVVKDAAGNTTTVTFSIDQTKPSGSLTINGNANFTNTLATTLNVDVTDASNDLHMRFSHDISDPARWSSWEAVTASKAWTLSTGDGTKTVYMEVKDQAGNIASFRDEITLDMTKPAGSFEINLGKPSTNTNKVTLAIESADAHAVEMRLSNDNLTWSEWKTAPAKGDVAWELDGIDGTKTVYLELKDSAGNQLALSKQITLDSTPPVVTGVADEGIYAQDVTITFNDGTATLNDKSFTSGSTVSAEDSYVLLVTDAAENRTTVRFKLDKTPPDGTFRIENGAAYTKTEDVSLQLSSTGNADDIEMMITNADDNAGTWERFAEAKAWKLADGSVNGPKTVYVKLKDKAGNITKLSDTIELDGVAPTGSITINNGDTHTTSPDATLTVAASDSTSDVQVRFANGDNDWSNWESVAATKAWQLKSGDGTKTVDMEIKDEAGNTTTVSDTIELDGDAPVVKGVEDKGIYNTDVTITFNEGTATLNGSPFASGDQVTIDGVHELRVVDASRNETKLTFTLDKTAPTGTFVINNDDRVTYSTSVKLNITATDHLGKVELRVSNEKGKWSSWDAVNGSVPWSLTNGNGTKKVLVQLRDEAGNTTDLEDSIELYVPNPPDTPTKEPVTGVELDEEELSLRVGETDVLHATVKPENATNKRVKWESSDPEIVEVDEEGKITAISPGTATITVTTEDGNKTDSVEVTVKDAVTFQLEATDTSFWLKPKASTSFKLYMVEGKKRKDITREKTVEYETQDGLVTVKQGRITAGKEEGEDTITVRYMGEELELAVVVSKKTVRSLTTSFKDVVLEVDEEKQLTLTAIFSDKSTDEVTEEASWSSSNEEVIVVSKEGKLTALAEGKAVITAKYAGKKVTQRVLVVEEKQVNDLRVSRSSLRLKADKTGEIILYAVYGKGYQEIVTKDAEWTVEDAEIATVENGVVTALSPGQTTVTADYGGETITIRITVW